MSSPAECNLYENRDFVYLAHQSNQHMLKVFLECCIWPHCSYLNKAICLRINSSAQGINIHLTLLIFKKSTKEDINILSKADLTFPNLLSNGKYHSVSWEKNAKFSCLTSVFELEFLGDKIPSEILWARDCYSGDLFLFSIRPIKSL